MKQFFIKIKFAFTAPVVFEKNSLPELGNWGYNIFNGPFLYQFEFSLVRVVFTSRDVKKKHARTYSIDVIAVLNPSVCFSAFNFCVCNLPLPPSLDGFPCSERLAHPPECHFSVEEELQRQEEKVKLQKIVDEKNHRERLLADAEQQWNDEFTDLTLFVIFGELLIFMISAYRRSNGGGGGGW